MAMQRITCYENSPNGMQLATPDSGGVGAKIARMQAEKDVEIKSILDGMHEAALRAKEEGNMAMKACEFRAAVKKYSDALAHADSMATFLSADKEPELNGYQLRAKLRGMDLPKRGPAQLNPFRSLCHANRSLAWLRLDAYDRAQKDAEKAVEFEPKYLKAWFRRAAALAAANLVDDAILVLNQALTCACPPGDDRSRQTVCNLMVNLRALKEVDVKPPQDDLPVVEAGKPKKKKEVVKIPKGAREALTKTEPEKDPTEFREVDVKDVELFIGEDWHPTHLGGHWRQTREDVTIVVTLPKKPKPTEIRVQIKPNALWVMLLGDWPEYSYALGHTQDGWTCIVDHAILRTVRPHDSFWVLGGGESKDSMPELHLTLQKAPVYNPKEEGGLQLDLWDRAFENDEPINTDRIIIDNAHEAVRRREIATKVVTDISAKAKQCRAEGKLDEAKALEQYIEKHMKRLGIKK